MWSPGCARNPTPDGADAAALAPASDRGSVVPLARGEPSVDAVAQAPRQGLGPGKEASSDSLGVRPQPVGGPWVTCYGRFRPSRNPARDVAWLGELCGPVNGMARVGDTIEGGSRGVERTLDAEGGDCFRVFAVGDEVVSDLAVDVRGPRGAVVAADSEGDRWPILNPEGPFCVLQSGRYVVHAWVRRGSGHFALEIWKLTPLPNSSVPW